MQHANSNCEINTVTGNLDECGVFYLNKRKKRISLKIDTAVISGPPIEHSEHSVHAIEDSSSVIAIEDSFLLNQEKKAKNVKRSCIKVKTKSSNKTESKTKRFHFSNQDLLVEPQNEPDKSHYVSVLQKPSKELCLKAAQVYGKLCQSGFYDDSHVSLECVDTDPHSYILGNEQGFTSAQLMILPKTGEPVLSLEPASIEIASSTTFKQNVILGVQNHIHKQDTPHEKLGLVSAQNGTQLFTQGNFFRGELTDSQKYVLDKYIFDNIQKSRNESVSENPHTVTSHVNSQKTESSQNFEKECDFLVSGNPDPLKENLQEVVQFQDTSMQALGTEKLAGDHERSLEWQDVIDENYVFTNESMLYNDSDGIFNSDFYRKDYEVCEQKEMRKEREAAEQSTLGKISEVLQSVRNMEKEMSVREQKLKAREIQFAEEKKDLENVFHHKYTELSKSIEQFSALRSLQLKIDYEKKLIAKEKETLQQVKFKVEYEKLQWEKDKDVYRKQFITIHNLLVTNNQILMVVDINKVKVSYTIGIDEISPVFKVLITRENLSTIITNFYRCYLKKNVMRFVENNVIYMMTYTPSINGKYIVLVIQADRPSLHEDGQSTFELFTMCLLRT